MSEVTNGFASDIEMFLTKVKLSFSFRLFPQATLTSVGRFHVMSLISKQGDSLLEIVNIVGDNGPSFKCTGMYDEAASKYFPCHIRYINT